MRRSSESITNGIIVDSEYDDWPLNDEEEEQGDDHEDEDDLLSEVSSVPTTVPYEIDERTATSALFHKEKFSRHVLMIGLFLTIAVVASVCIYGFANNEENLAFEQEFEFYADQILAASRMRVNAMIRQLETLGLSFTNYALGAGDVWPTVTIPNFQAQASNFLSEFPAESFALSVLVAGNARGRWEDYSVSNQGWIEESYNYIGLDDTDLPEITPYIYRVHPNNGTKYEDSGDSQSNTMYAPFWLASVTNDETSTRVNYNTLDDDAFAEIEASLPSGTSTTVLTPPRLDRNAEWVPKSTFGTSVLDGFASASSVPKRVGTLSSSVYWNSFFQNILSESMMGPIIMVLDDTCGMSFSYVIDGPNVEFIEATSEPNLPSGQPKVEQIWTNLPVTNGCALVVHLAASDDLSESSRSNKPLIYTISVFAVFAIMGLFFYFYERWAHRSMNATPPEVARSKSIVEAMFPSSVRDRVLNDKIQKRNSSISNKEIDPLGQSRRGQDKPIADLHPNVTVLFADIVDFTAWASVREPSQVFLLLETLYDAFDKLTRKFKIFKVETIGDCYVAVSGLPEPAADHAVAMARFAQDIIIQMHRIVKQLEVSLGPETGDLGIRVGMNSGPVTAGVLRGEKSRFQLFGDTVNTTSRIENTGARNRIHVSGTTAALIERDGHASWLIPREDMVSVKGKGEMKTYWLWIGGIKQNPNCLLSSPIHGGGGAMWPPIKFPGSDLSRRSNDDHSMMEPSLVNPDEKRARLVNWSADLLLGLLKRVVAMRESEETMNELKDFHDIVKGLDGMGGLSGRTNSNIDGAPRVRKDEPTITPRAGGTVLDEVAEIISLPRKASRYQQDPAMVDLGDAVVTQLYRYVSEVAKMYRNNPFHNFDHASHVTQSLTKLLSRVVAPDAVDYENMTYKRKTANRKLHKFTYGITSDPLTQFACAFSSLIHDLDHPGVPNAVLVSEETDIAEQYRNKSVAEQNSVDLAWSLLMQPRFVDLRRCIYKTQTELDRFRHLVVNSVMATDIVDKELGALRKARWEKAFSKNPSDEVDERATDEVNRKATIVIEHLIQAADVAHTMQHWHVYLKWNERFFHECYAVYLSGRTDKDPSEGWYKGEIGFFDFYIIPLAKKLENCGVFGVSSDECLQYAKANRDEWERKGDGIVKRYLAAYKSEVGANVKGESI